MRHRLGTVLRLRGIAERQAAGALAGAQRDLRQAEELVAQRCAATAATPLAGAPLSPLQLRALELQRLAGHDLVQAAVSARDEADERRGELARAWSLASTRRRSVERLDERRSAEAAAAARAAADRALDEIVLLVHGRERP